MLRDGRVFDSAGVNVSVVHGVLPAELAEMAGRGGGRGDVRFWATGVSVVIHPRNPMVPTMHANYRYFEMQDAPGTAPGAWWFGGGSDLTPAYLFRTTRGISTACCAQRAMSRPGLLPALQATMRRLLPAAPPRRAPGRGRHLLRPARRSRTGRAVAFVTSFAQAIVPAYFPIVRRRRDERFTRRHRAWQQLAAAATSSSTCSTTAARTSACGPAAGPRAFSCRSRPWRAGTTARRKRAVRRRSCSTSCAGRGSGHDPSAPGHARQRPRPDTERNGGRRAAPRVARTGRRARRAPHLGRRAGRRRRAPARHGQVTVRQGDRGGAAPWRCRSRSALGQGPPRRAPERAGNRRGPRASSIRGTCCAAPRGSRGCPAERRSAPPACVGAHSCLPRGPTSVSRICAATSTLGSGVSARDAFDAIVLAAAGLSRLGVAAGTPLPPNVMVPAPGQGCLAVEARTATPVHARSTEPLDHLASRRQLLAERAVARRLGAGCQTPLGVHARPEGPGELTLAAFAGLPDGSLACGLRCGAARGARGARCRSGRHAACEGSGRVLSGEEAA